MACKCHLVSGKHLCTEKGHRTRSYGKVCLAGSFELLTSALGGLFDLNVASCHNGVREGAERLIAIGNPAIPLVRFSCVLPTKSRLGRRTEPFVLFMILYVFCTAGTLTLLFHRGTTLEYRVGNRVTLPRRASPAANVPNPEVPVR